MLRHPDGSDGWRTFAEGARRGQLLLRRCESCATYHGPGAQFCDECSSGELAWRASSKLGVLRSFTTVHQPFAPGLAVPYTVGSVEMEEGPYIVCRAAGQDLPAIGMAVRIEFPDGEADAPYFRPR